MTGCRFRRGVIMKGIRKTRAMSHQPTKTAGELRRVAIEVVVGEALAIVARESGIDAKRISTSIRQGGIYHEILEEAADIKADLIVMTSHRPSMQNYFLGSNAGHIVRYAKCSVLVVRQ